MKVMTVLGTRPEIIRLSRVLNKFDQHFEHVLVHTGQNYDYELNEIFFKDLELKKPKHFLDAAGTSPLATIGNILTKMDSLLDSEKPEAVLVLGDTNSCFAAYAAKRKKIPVFHMEAGNRCYDQRVPEEINRKVIDHISDINLPYSDIAREYLLAEGIPAERVIKTGSPMFEVLNYHRAGIDASKALGELGVQKGKYFVVSVHREENIDNPKHFQSLVTILNRLAERFGMPILVSTHPRTQKRIDQQKVKFHSEVQLLKPLGFKDYVNLQINAKAVLSDSGTITEESSILGFPALNVREAHERPEGFEEASVMMTGLNEARVFKALEILEGQSEIKFRTVADYSMPNVSDKVVRIVLSYTDFVNRTIWHK